MDILVPHGEEELIEVSSAPVDPVQQRHVNILVIPGFDVMQEIMTEASASDEAVLFSQDAKLLRCRVNEWEDRSNGKAVLFLHAPTGRLRFSMRQDGTRAILGQAKITKSSVLFQCNGGWKWSAVDTTNEEPVPCVLALQFASMQQAAHFKELVDEAKDFMA